MCCAAPRKNPTNVSKALASVWVKHCGMPELLITDQGGEFTGRDFTQYIAGQAGLQHVIDAQSPFQQGRTECAGASLKEGLRNVVCEFRVVTEAQFDIALSCAVEARNRFLRGTGIRIDPGTQRINESL
eukprot:5705924-Karenia_brevis.AAC.1